ncbi:MAG: endonuclease III [Halobacteria archaeon]|nr:endonuclease III [Halobacteria archaeon]
MDRDERSSLVLERLKEEYPDADTTLDYQNPFELLVATVLSAQCTDERVNQVTPELFDEYPTPEEMAEADVERIQEIVHSTGFYKSKADYLKQGSRLLVENFDGEVPESVDELTQLPGVGRKTANVVVSNAFGVDEGIAVDTHVLRLTERLELTDSPGDRDCVEEDLMELVPEDDWRLVSHLLIFHGREVCSARSPDCDECVLEDICPSSRLGDG